ncbi:MAG: hypothetical protein AB1481_04240 [Candidatus Omnitrophota bacterium]
MIKTFSVLAAICWLFSSAVPLDAQGMLLNPYSQYTPPALENENLVKARFVEQNINDHELLKSVSNSLALGLYRWNTMEPNTPVNGTVNRKVFRELYNKAKPDEKELIRQAWKKAFGMDVWYPYYKAKDVERWVKKRLSVKIFKLKGEPEFEKNRILYTFKVKY